jgi:hypothetical protein
LANRIKKKNMVVTRVYKSTFVKAYKINTMWTVWLYCKIIGYKINF